MFNENFVCTHEKVGNFRLSVDQRDTRHFRPKNEPTKQGGNVVTYFCTPAGQVLHFVVGPVDPDALENGVRWLLNTYQSQVEFESEKELVEYWTKAHRAAAESRSFRVYETMLDREGIKVRPIDQLSDANIANAIRLAENRPRTILQHITGIISLQRSSPGQELSNFDENHRVLSCFGGANIARIERHVFEFLADQPKFERRDPRSDQLLSRMQENVESRRPVVMVLCQAQGTIPDTDAPTTAAQSTALRSAEVRFPKHRGLQNQLAKFDVVHLTREEATTLFDDLGKKPIRTFSGWDDHLLVLNSYGQPVASILKRKSRYIATYADDQPNIQSRYLGKLMARVLASVLVPTKSFP